MSDTILDTTMPGMPERRTTPDTRDTRMIAEMRFGTNYSPSEPMYGKNEKGERIVISKLWEPTPDQEQEQAWVRAYLTVACGCVVASDIEELGCTGVARVESDRVAGSGLAAAAISNGTRLRLGLGGGGVGLPCFVSGDRFCLVHNTVGGLQDHQQPLHSAFVEMISRELTPQERVQTGLVTKARRMRGGERTVDAMDALSGQNQEILEEVAGGLDGKEARDDSDAFPAIRLGAPPWKCTEHTTLTWECRYCLAQAVVEGSLVPGLAVHVMHPQDIGLPPWADVPAAQVKAVLDHADKMATPEARVYVEVVRLTRKLARG